jgi:hypothetical protein
MHANGQCAASEYGSANLRLGSLIGTNCVKRDVGKHLDRELLSFFYVQHGTALVRTALGAGAMGQLLFVAVGALREADRGKKVVGAAEGGAAR